MNTNRRQVLATLAAGAAFAGCVSENPGDDSGTDDGNGSGGGDPEPTGEPPVSNLPDESFPEECPAYDGVDRVICYDAADGTEVPALLEPSARQIGEGDPLEFSLHNRSETTLQTNFYNWRLSKRVDDEWHLVEPRGHEDPLMAVEAGERHVWTVTVDNDGIGGRAIPGASGTSDLAIEGLGGGHYAFRARGWFEGETYEEAIAFAATFELDADPIQLTQTDAIEETEWDGETLVATSSRGEPDGTLGAFELERLDGYDGEADRVVTEQLLRDNQRRDAVALAETYDADHVRLEEYTSAIPVFGSRSDGVFAYQGTYYDVSTAKLEG